jgi:uncharacterized tellurite resistance protein B-like protein
MTNVRVADGVLYLRVSGRFPVLLSRHFMEELRFRLAPDVWATLYADDKLRHSHDWCRFRALRSRLMD